MKVNYPYSSKQNFREVTNEREDVVEVIRAQMKDTLIEVYECKDTAIIFSQNNESKHASISNGSRPVQEWEIGYAIARILKVKTKEVDIYITENDVVHIHYEKGNRLLN